MLRFVVILIWLPAIVLSDYIEPVISMDFFNLNSKSAACGYANKTVLLFGGNIMSNPAAVHASFLKNKKHYFGEISYLQDKIYKNKIVIDAGYFFNEKGSVSSRYAMLINNKNDFINAAVFSYGGLLFSQKDEQGPVSVGLNIKYYSVRNSVKNDSLDKEVKTLVSGAIISDSLYKIYYPHESRYEEEHILADIGFYQSDVFPGFDFSLIFYNFVGHVWNNNKNVVEYLRDTVYVDTITTKVIDSAIVNFNPGKKSLRINRILKRIGLGFNYSPPIENENFSVSIPFDMLFFSVFHKDYEREVFFSAGANILIAKKVKLNFGYSRTPLKIYKNEKKRYYYTKENLFSGGIGINTQNIGFDVYINSNSEWGTTISIAY